MSLFLLSFSSVSETAHIFSIKNDKYLEAIFAIPISKAGRRRQKSIYISIKYCIIQYVKHEFTTKEREGWDGKRDCEGVREGKNK